MTGIGQTGKADNNKDNGEDAPRCRKRDNLTKAHCGDGDNCHIQGIQNVIVLQDHIAGDAEAEDAQAKEKSNGKAL
jgi:hypothetical protein